MTGIRFVPSCRFCGGQLAEVVDFGMAPPGGRALAVGELAGMEAFHPLVLRVCADCFLVQIEPCAGDDHGLDGPSRVADINAFAAGLRAGLGRDGQATAEMPHLLPMITGNHYDTIGFAHLSYFSLTTAERLFAAHGLRVFAAEADGDRLSLRLSLCPEGDRRPTAPRVAEIKYGEAAAGLDRPNTYRRFAEQIRQAKWNLVDFLIRARWYGRSAAVCGAPAEAATLLTYAGLRGDVLDYAVECDLAQPGGFTPGTRIPICAPDRLRQTRPDYLLILPSRLQRRIMAEHAYIRDWGGQFLVAVPDLTVFP